MRVRTVVLASVLIATSAPVFAQNRACDRLYRQYQEADGPKAWAVSPDGGCGYASRRSAPTLSQARRMAYEYCSESARGCRVTEEDYR